MNLIRDTIRLGEPLTRLSRYARPIGDTAITVPAREFGGADEIEVYRAPDGPVHRVVFLYSQQRDVAALLADYRESLGAPADSAERNSTRGHLRLWTWRDARTEFVFILVQPPFEGVGAMSVLQERGLPLAIP